MTTTADPWEDRAYALLAELHGIDVREARARFRERTLAGAVVGYTLYLAAPEADQEGLVAFLLCPSCGHRERMEGVTGVEDIRSLGGRMAEHQQEHMRP
jgi:hypothetical protein